MITSYLKAHSACKFLCYLPGASGSFTFWNIKIITWAHPSCFEKSEDLQFSENNHIKYFIQMFTSCFHLSKYYIASKTTKYSGHQVL